MLERPSPRPTDSGEVRAEINQSLEHWRQHRSLDDVPRLEAALALARSEGDACSVGRVLVALGQAAAITAQGARAVQCAEEALELLKPLLPLTNADVVAALRVVGRVQYDYGNDDQALAVFQEALGYDNPPSERVALQGNIAAIQIELGYYQEAIETFETLLPVAQGLHNEEEVAHLRGNYALAWQCLARAQSDETLRQRYRARALEEAQAALTGAQALGLKSLASHTHRTMADLLLEQHALEAAKAHLLSSLALAQETQSPGNELHTLHYLARVALLQAQPEVALEYVRRALPQALERGLQDHAAQIHERFAEIFEVMGDYRSALEHERLGFALHNQVRSEAASRRVEALGAQLQLERSRLQARFERERAETLARINEQLTHQALTDPLTGIANRRALMDHLERAHAAAQRSGQGLCVALFDLDHFKQINDRHSHAVGDAVLRRIGRILQEECRKGDFVARYGGEEFALVLEGANMHSAFEVCERLRLRIEHEPWQRLHAGLRVTASFGYCAQETLDGFEGLLSLADQHLYTAKSAGRNRVHPPAA
jgi:diguanylate cyclase (GGDEF)-like protein